MGVFVFVLFVGCTDAWQGPQSCGTQELAVLAIPSQLRRVWGVELLLCGLLGNVFCRLAGGSVRTGLWQDIVCARV